MTSTITEGGEGIMTPTFDKSLATWLSELPGNSPYGLASLELFHNSRHVFVTLNGYSFPDVISHLHEGEYHHPDFQVAGVSLVELCSDLTTAAGGFSDSVELFLTIGSSEVGVVLRCGAPGEYEYRGYTYDLSSIDSLDVGTAFMIVSDSLSNCIAEDLYPAMIPYTPPAIGPWPGGI